MAVVNRRRKFDLDIERAFSPSQQIIKKWGRGTSIQHPTMQDLEAAAVFRLRSEQKSIKEHFHALAEKLCGEHTMISVDNNIFGGVPHIKDVRLSVGDVLSKIYVYGNIQKVVDIYAPHVSEEHVKEAIAYAQDFLENACDPDDSSETDD
jgi:uncharacterized protein (DUF433 family)